MSPVAAVLGVTGWRGGAGPLAAVPEWLAAALPALSDPALKGLAVLAVAAAVDRALRRGPSALRHRVWAVAVTALLLLPAAKLALPAWPVVPLPGAVAAAAAAAEVESPGGFGSVASADPAEPAEAAAPRVTSDGAARGGEASAGPRAPRGVDAVAGPGVAPPSPGASPRATPRAPGAGAYAAGARDPAARMVDALPAAAAGLWLLGTAGLLVLLADGLAGIRGLARRARPADEADARAALAHAAGRLALDRPVRLLRSDEVAVPVTWGARRPTVVLPADSAAWPADRLGHVLLHELAHVARGDWAAQVAARVALALHWPNPLAWLAVRRLRQERETACDDHVLAAGVRPSEYAGHLVAVARAGLRGRRPVAALPMAARPAELTRRVGRILDPRRRSPDRKATGRLPGRWATGLVVAALVAPLAAMAPAGPADAGGTTGSVPGSASEALADAPAPPAGLPVRAPGAAGGPEAVPEAAADAVPQAVPQAVPEADPPAADPSLRAATCFERDGGGRTSIHSDSDRRLLDIEIERDDCEIDLRVEGEIVFADAETTIVRMSPGSSFEVEERDGGVRRYLAAEPGEDGRPRWTWRVDGRERPFDDEARRWLAEILPGIFRNTGWDAERRVARILRTSGVEGVLDEIDRISSDHAARRYYGQLVIQAELTPSQERDVFERAGRDIGSDYELAELLLFVAEREGLPVETHGAFLDAVATLGSDYEMRRVLTALLELDDLEEPVVERLLEVAAELGSDYELAQLLLRVVEVSDLRSSGRERYLALVSSLDSDYEMRRVLDAFLDRVGPDRADVATLLGLAGEIASDHELVQFLVRLARVHRLDGELGEAYLEALEGVGSDYERRRALDALLQGRDLSRNEIVLVLEAAGRFRSPHERAELLVALARGRELDGELRERYRAAAAEIRSEHERDRALAALGSGAR